MPDGLTVSFSRGNTEVPRVVILDTGPLGDASKPRGNPSGDATKAWIQGLLSLGDTIVIPEIADYEVRRELTRANANAGIRSLNLLVSSGSLVFAPITSDAMRSAAQFWAIVRNLGLPTAPPEALDGDAILAGQAQVLMFPGSVVIIATTNVGHLGRFPGIDARLWNTIT
jgi:hypothetical protein